MSEETKSIIYTLVIIVSCIGIAREVVRTIDSKGKGAFITIFACAVVAAITNVVLKNATGNFILVFTRGIGASLIPSLLSFFFFKYRGKKKS